MPQASEELRAMFRSDSHALQLLRQNFNLSRGGIIHPKLSGYEPTCEEGNAITYLIHEWDYGYSEKPYGTA